MIDPDDFDDPGQARQVLDSASRLLGAITGLPTTVRLVAALDPALRARVLQLGEEVFAGDRSVFEGRDLDEVAADPDALFVVVEVDGAVEGCCFGYYENPGEETVQGTDFFADTALVSTRWQNHGFAAAAGASVLLLIALLGDVDRVGIAVWDGGQTDLPALYRRYGFVDATGRRTALPCMAVDLEPARVDSWRSALGLPPAGGRR